FARIGVGTDRYLDLSLDGSDERLARYSFPVLRTPEQLARWLELPMGHLAWLVHRFAEDARPQSEREAHYHYRWVTKRSGGRRLIESPKRTLKQAQRRILKEILEKVPPHDAAHGFSAGRSILTNARPHVKQDVVVKFDLANFYPSVTFARVTAIFRSLGYSREAAIWLARLTTSALPANIPFVKEAPSAILPYLKRHLPQGAPTSPALANLSAYSLDVRLVGLARSFGANYTRYADDLTFSGPSRFGTSLRDFIPLVGQIVRQERFRLNAGKRKILRSSGKLIVTGVVVNEKINVSRREFDRLKAVLTNCVRHGALGQNKAGHPHFAAHLRGRIAQVTQLNPTRGARLLAVYNQIDWNR
ncbi:MAG TPA: reverse transcriptase family protein, partial [Planctomycetaceae bacterium]|nr:reverse transcriptase family protein [Planctomycetaceae bacterium]